MKYNKEESQVWRRFNKWFRPYARLRFAVLIVLSYFGLIVLVEKVVLSDEVKSSQTQPERIIYVLGVVLALGAAMLYRQFMPTVNVKVTPRWEDPKEGVLALSLEVENKSRIGIYRHKKSVTVQALEHDLPDDFQYRGEWVSINKDHFDKCEKAWDSMAKWSTPINVMTTEGIFEPDQASRVEVLRKCSADKWIHCLINFRCRLNPLGMWLRWQSEDSFTMTAWIAPADRASKS